MAPSLSDILCLGPTPGCASDRLQDSGQRVTSVFFVRLDTLHSQHIRSEFLAVATHPRIYDPPTSLPKALDQVSAWLESPSLTLLAEGLGYPDRLTKVLEASKVTGAKVHDARVAALCLYHGVRELWSADRDFTRFAELAVRNPLVG